MRFDLLPLKLTLRRILPWVSTGAIVGYLLWTTSRNGAWQANPVDLIPPQPWWILVLILAMPANWLLEAWKWHRLLLRNAAFKDSFREVLIGASWAFITPNRAGDVVARVALLPKGSRAQGARAFMTGAFAQMWITTFAGTCAWWMVYLNEPESLFQLSKWTFGIGALLVALTLLGLCFYLLWRWPRMWSRFASASTDLQSEPLSLKLRIETLLLSFLRFGVFSGQFFAALTAWGISISGIKAWYIPLVYLGNMIIPSAALSEMGSREALTLALFQPEASHWWATAIAVFSIWVINLGVPALAGGILSLRRKTVIP